MKMMKKLRALRLHLHLSFLWLPAEAMAETAAAIILVPQDPIHL